MGTSISSPESSAESSPIDSSDDDSDNEVDFLSNVTSDLTPIYDGLEKLSPTQVPSNQTIEVNIENDVDFLSNVTSDVTPTYNGLTKQLPTQVPTNETISSVTPTWSDLTKLSPVSTPASTDILSNLTSGVSPSYQGQEKTLPPSPVPTNETGSEDDGMTSIINLVPETLFPNENVSPLYQGQEKSLPPVPVPTNETISDAFPTWSDLTKLSPVPTPVSTDILSNLTSGISPSYQGQEKTLPPSPVPTNETITEIIPI